MEKIKNYIGGELVPPLSGQYLNNWEPATGEIYSQIADSDEQDVNRAVAAARKAFPAWSATTATARAKILRKIAGLVETRRDELARAETIDNGKPLSVSETVDIPRSAYNFEFFA